MKATSENIAPKLQRDYLLHKRLQHLVGEAIKDFDLIETNDRVLIGLSGGKDSLALLDLMGERMKRSNGKFSLEAVHVRMKNIQYESDTSYLEQKAAEWGIPFHVVETGFDVDRKEKELPASCVLGIAAKRCLLWLKIWAVQKSHLGITRMIY